MTEVRTRFAPSPTGYMHVGGVRTALFAWLTARQKGGAFILRIEDTDKSREVEGAEQHIIESLKALGLDWDEGPDIGGPYGPYRQSERLDTYKRWAQRLIDQGRAYADPYTQDDMQRFREEAVKAKRPFLYRDHRPADPPAWNGATPLRFKSDPKAYERTDLVMGNLKTGTEMIDDFIMIKSDGYPTYNFAHIVDDTEMKVSTVIRGQEFLASIPNYLNMYEALGVVPPEMATMPHILGPDGKKKLSKRDGAKDVLDYIREGYLPDALLNFIASLGWNDGTEQELFSKQNLIEKFSLTRVQSSGARFDERRLLWMDGAHIRELIPDELLARCQPFWPEEAEGADEMYKKRVALLIQDRIKYFAELPDLTRFFFADLPVDPELIRSHKQLSKLAQERLRELLEISLSALEKSEFTSERLQETLNTLLETTNEKPAVLFSLIRIAVTEAAASPGLADTLALLGHDRSVNRMRTQLDALK